MGSAARADFPGHGGLENVGVPPALHGFAMTFSDSGIRGQYTNGRGATGPWDGPAGRIIGPELKDLVGGRLENLLSLVVLTDDDVQPENRIGRSGLPVADEHGPVPKPQIWGRNRSARTLRNRELLARRAAEIIRGAGARQVYRIDWAPLLLHIQSSMRMGESEKDSVLDADTESRAVAALYIADTSMLANSLGGPNPTLATQALATRTAEKIFQRHFGGTPWVRAEAPVVSTDPRISVRLGELGL